MRKIWSLLLVLVIVSGCSWFKMSKNTYSTKLGDWIGKNAQLLYDKWGFPQHTTPVDANTYILTYFASEDEPIDGNLEPYADDLSYDAMSVPNYGLPIAEPLYYCKTSFVVRNNIIVDYNFNGDDCY